MTTAREVLQNLIPISTISESSMEEVIKAIHISHADTYEILFHEGDADSESMCLLQGAV